MCECVCYHPPIIQLYRHLLFMYLFDKLKEHELDDLVPNPVFRFKSSIQRKRTGKIEKCQSHQYFVPSTHLTQATSLHATVLVRQPGSYAK